MSSPKLHSAPLSEVFNAGLITQLLLLEECCRSTFTFLSHLSTSLLPVNSKLVSASLCAPVWYDFKCHRKNSWTEQNRQSGLTSVPLGRHDVWQGLRSRGFPSSSSLWKTLMCWSVKGCRPSLRKHRHLAAFSQFLYPLSLGRAPSSSRPMSPFTSCWEAKQRARASPGQSAPVRPRPLREAPPTLYDTAATRWRCRLYNGAARCWCQDEAGVLMAALNKLLQFSQPAGPWDWGTTVNCSGYTLGPLARNHHFRLVCQSRL